LVLEYADGGSLQSYLKNNFQGLNWDNKFELAHQLASSVLWLHGKGIIHRDLVIIIFNLINFFFLSE
jgi:serine/threonine protein kinase